MAWPTARLRRVEALTPPARYCFARSNCSTTRVMGTPPVAARVDERRVTDLGCVVKPVGRNRLGSGLVGEPNGTASPRPTGPTAAFHGADSGRRARATQLGQGRACPPFRCA